MKKRNIVCFLLVLGIVFSVVGCSQSSSSEKSEDGKITLTLWYWNRSIDDELIKKVGEEFPDITIKPQKIDGDNYKTKLQTTLAADGGPDIVAMNDWVNEFIPYSDNFVNLLDYGADEIKNQYLEWKWNYALTPDKNTLIALPMDTGPTALFYRADFFEEAGLPTDPTEVSEQLSTWDDYIAAGEKLKEATGLKMFDSSNRVFTQYLAQSEQNYFDRDNKDRKSVV